MSQEHSVIDRQPLILIVEDMIDNLELEVDIIESEGLGAVVTASNSQEAKKVLGKLQDEGRLPDLLWIDAHLPIQSGLEFLDEIDVPGSVYAGIPVLVSTGLRNNDDLIAAFQRHNLVGFHYKPFDITDVVIDLKKVLRPQINE